MAAMSAGIFGGIAGAQHRRSLSVLTSNLGSGTPPTTSRQSSGLDTIAEDADSARPSAGQLDEGVALADDDGLTTNSNEDSEPPSFLLNGQPSQQQQNDEAVTPDPQEQPPKPPRPQRPRRLQPTSPVASRGNRLDADDDAAAQEENPWELRETPGGQSRRQHQTQETFCVTEYLATT
uniref:DIDO1 n=2 Tax=Macrostomum lignano TaxID=282301 RepID=A0A1I8JC50_9PLAT